MTNYLPREIAYRLEQALRLLPVVVLSALRQTGKSTLLQREESLTTGRKYRTLDDFATLAAAQANPESLLTEAVILDEVQRCPELLLALKKAVDEQRRPGRFILSGSANLALLSRVSESLAGCATRLLARAGPPRSGLRDRGGSHGVRGGSQGGHALGCK